MKVSIGLITVVLIFMNLNLTKNSFATAEQMEPNEELPPEEPETTYNQGVCQVIRDMICKGLETLVLNSVNEEVADTAESKEAYDDMLNGLNALSEPCLYALFDYVCVPAPTQQDVIKRKFLMKGIAATHTSEAEKCKATLIYKKFVTPEETAEFVNG